MTRPITRVRAWSVVVVACLGLSWSTASAATAGADPGERPLLRLSRSGEHWRDSLHHPLFGPGIRWVPGDVRTRRFQVSNRGDAPGRLRLHLVRLQRDPLLRTGHLTIATRIGRRHWVRVREPSRGALVGTRGIRPGRVVLVRVRVRLAADAPASTERLRTHFRVRGTLTDPPRSGVAPAVDGDLTPLSQLLPDDAPAWAPWTALGLLGLGAFVAADRRHRRGTTRAVTSRG